MTGFLTDSVEELDRNLNQTIRFYQEGPDTPFAMPFQYHLFQILIIIANALLIIAKKSER